MNALALAAGSSPGVETVLPMLLVAVPLVAYVLLVLGALISVLGSPQEFGMKLVWIVFVFIAPFIGSLAWFLIGRGNSRRMAAHVHIHR